MGNRQSSTEADPKAWSARMARLASIWGPEQVSRLHGASVALVGCGALGGQLLPHLAMWGVNHIMLVDNGLVEPPNLGNQGFAVDHLDMPKVLARTEQIHRINPGCEVDAHAERLEHLGWGVFQGLDLLFCCLDTLHARILLNEICLRLELDWVDAATEGDGQHLFGRVASFGGQPEAPCFVCGYAREELAAAMQADQTSCPSWRNQGKRASLPTLSASPESAVVSGLQAIYGVRRLFGETAHEKSVEVQINLDVPYLREVALTLDARCTASHESYGEPVPLSARHSLAETFDRAERRLGHEALLELAHKSFVAAVRCVECQRVVAVGKAETAVPKQGVPCPCGAMAVPGPHALLDQLERSEVQPYLSRSWKELGLPPEDVVIATGKHNGGRMQFLIRP